MLTVCFFISTSNCQMGEVAPCGPIPSPKATEQRLVPFFYILTVVLVVFPDFKTWNFPPPSAPCSDSTWNLPPHCAAALISGDAATNKHICLHVIRLLTIVQLMLHS